MQKKRKVFLLLKGGLGNQLFQYAAGCFVSKMLNRELVIDTKMGFNRDKIYKRSYELKGLIPELRTANPINRIPYFMYLFLNKLTKEKALFSGIKLKWFGNFILDDRNNEYLRIFDGELINILNNKNNIWIDGYFQSYKYLNSEFAKNILLDKLKIPQDSIYAKIEKLISNKNSVAIGLRKYEETNDPSKYSVSYEDSINSLINFFIKKNNKTTFFVFSTKRSNISNKLNLPRNTIYLTADDGYTDSLSSIWLLSKAYNHIITNSSFYWWGAWFSIQNYGGVKAGQDIFASKDFNSDTLLKDWKTF